MLRSLVSTIFLTLVPVALAAQGPVRWYGKDFEATLRLARSSDKMVLVYFWAEGSAHCGAFWEGSLQSPSTQGSLAKMVCFGANAATTEGAALLQRYAVQTLPTVLLLDAKTTSPEDALFGNLPAAELVLQLDRVLSGTGTVSALRSVAAADRDDLELLYDLALKLQYVRDTKTAQIHFDTIREADPTGKTNGGAQLLLGSLVAGVRSSAKDSGDPRTYGLEPILRYLRKKRPPAIHFVAWDWVASIEVARSDCAAAMKAWQKAAKHLPPKRYTDWPVTVVDAMWTERTSLSREDVRGLRKVIERCYAPIVKRLQDLGVSGKAGDHAPADEQLFMQSLALARIRYLAGARKEARQMVDAALKLEPGNGLFQTLDRILKGKSGG